MIRLSSIHDSFIFAATWLIFYCTNQLSCTGKKGFGGFLHYVNASVEVLLGTNIQSLVLFVIITLAISLKLVSLRKWKKSGQNSKSWLQAKINYYNSVILLYFPWRSGIHRFKSRPLDNRNKHLTTKCYTIKGARLEGSLFQLPYSEAGSQ